MHRFLIFACFSASILSEQNLFSVVNSDESFSNSSYANWFNFYRCPRTLSNKANKPMDCRRLHATEDTPFIAIILNRASGRLICMGSIIDEKHILTAYRCIQNTNPDSLRILVGYFKAYWGHHSQVLYVEKVFKHEYDLSILRLKRSIVFSRTVKSIQLLRLEDGKSDSDGDKPDKPNGEGGKPGGGNGKPGSKGNNLSDGDSILNNTLTEKEMEIAQTDEVNENKVSNKTDKEANNSYVYNNGKKINEFAGHNDQLKSHNNKKRKIVPLNINLTYIKPENQTSRKEFLLFNKETETGYENLKAKQKRILYHVKRKDESLASGTLEELRKEKDQNPGKPTSPPRTPLPSFSATHPDIKEFLLVGFPLSSLDAVGDSISQTLVYGMKEEKLGKEGPECLKIYQDKPALKEQDDPDAPMRVFCSDGKSNFCWGCLGGPTLYKKEQEYIQVGVVGGTNCDKEENYLHIRVDINMKWISANSLIADRN